MLRMTLVKRLDPQGRLVIPREMLRGIGVEPKEFVEVYVGQDEDGFAAVFLRKYNAGCDICGDSTRNVYFKVPLRDDKGMIEACDLCYEFYDMKRVPPILDPSELNQ